MCAWHTVHKRRRLRQKSDFEREEGACLHAPSSRSTCVQVYLFPVQVAVIVVVLLFLLFCCCCVISLPPPQPHTKGVVCPWLISSGTQDPSTAQGVKQFKIFSLLDINMDGNYQCGYTTA